jgi:4-azaleucine resistance transporter AzlC
VPARFRDGVLAALPLSPGALLFSASFGLLAGDAGMSAAAALVMSATTFAGSAQFAAGSILETGGGAVAATVAALLLNARYAPMSVAVAGIFSGSRRRRLAEAQLIVDESWALAGRSGGFEYPVLIGAGTLLYVVWIGGTAVGTFAGDALGDPDAIGLDAAFPALFLALLVPYLRVPRATAAALAAAAITFVLTPFTPAGVPIVAASAACLLGLRR